MRKDTDFVLEILFFVSIGCKTSFIFLRKLSTLRSCVRAKAIVGALFIKTSEVFINKRLAEDRPEVCDNDGASEASARDEQLRDTPK